MHWVAIIVVFFCSFIDDNIFVVYTETFTYDTRIWINATQTKLITSLHLRNHLYLLGSGGIRQNCQGKRSLDAYKDIYKSNILFSTKRNFPPSIFFPSKITRKDNKIYRRTEVTDYIFWYSSDLTLEGQIVEGREHVSLYTRYPFF